MPRIKITNVTVEAAHGDTDYALGWETTEGRYHCWLTTNEFHPQTHGFEVRTAIGSKGKQIYKRPHGNDHKVVYLALAIGSNKAMFDDAMAEAKAGHLFEQANEKVAQAEKERLAQAAAEHKVKLAQDAGPRMLELLKAIDQFWTENDQKPPLAEAVRDAIAEAEGLPRA